MIENENIDHINNIITQFRIKYKNDWYFDSLISRNELTNNNLLLPCFRKSSNRSTIIINKDNVFKFEVNNNGFIFNGATPSSINLLNNFFIVKLTGYEKSAHYFGYGKIKKELFESKERVKINQIINDFKLPSGENISITELIVNDRKLKFFTSEVSVELPNMDIIMKGYTPPFDRTKKVNNNIKVIKKNYHGLTYGTKGIVKKLIVAGHKKYCMISVNDKNYRIEQNKIKVIK